MDDKEILARTLPPIEDLAVDGTFAGTLTASLRGELRGWIALSLAALGLAGLLALLLAGARVPGADAVFPFLDQGFFRRVLVVHVSFAFVVWYLGVQGALTVLATSPLAGPGGMSRGSRMAGDLGPRIAMVSFALLLAPIFIRGNVPSLNNYVPMVNDPVYFADLRAWR